MDIRLAKNRCESLKTSTAIIFKITARDAQNTQRASFSEADFFSEVNLIILQQLWKLLTQGAEPFLRSCQLCSYSRTSQHFTEPKDSSPLSQESSTEPYPEPGRSTPYHPHSISLKPIVILSTHLRLGLPSGTAMYSPKTHKNISILKVLNVYTSIPNFGLCKYKANFSLFQNVPNIAELLEK
jgi:hypothetical protein